jgi:3-hexulose-6-phosphate synthase (HPS) (D-arabino-3-hexulose-6-phosphate formaldehyde lyase)
VKAPIGDNLFFRQALDMAQEGDVIVVDGGSGCNRSLAEEIMLRVACKKGSVVDGCLRDLDGKNVAFLGSYSELYH